MKRRFLLFLATVLVLSAEAQSVKEVRRLNQQAVEVIDQEGHVTTFDFYGPNIVRMFRDDKGGILRNPKAMPPADILVSDARRNANVEVTTLDDDIIVTTQPLEMSSIHGSMLRIDKKTGLFTIWYGGNIVSQTAPVEFAAGQSGGYNIRLSMKPDEHFFGGGVQNGRFSHRGERINIVNTNSWTDGGVCSPAPFYWSTAGYGVLCHTFRPGYYDFGNTTKDQVTIHHDDDYLDLFFWTGDTPVALLDGYYQLTGHPVLLPKFAFYEGHLNAYNRDYWKETDDERRGILFEDGKRYIESQRQVDGGIRESLNGWSSENHRAGTDGRVTTNEGEANGDVGEYQFSGRAVIDRYNNADMPLGWVLPNDGYGAGYGQTETLDGNIQNLKDFGDYARSKGVEIGLWTQSNLHPIDSIPALLQRDIVKEVRDAGVRVLKTDVAWVGAGYSFGLNGIADVAQIMPYYGNQARPFIISLDGWAGTQRYAGIWTGDQTGGEWEYIRFHIPTFIGAGLSGMSNITNDMDGIFGGRNVAVNIRDFQWKTFTPMQLNMDGWGSNPKYPQALGEPATSINRSYLKLKSMLLPYTYTFAHEAINGKPLIRAMFLDDLNDFTLGKRTQYQFLYGPSLLVAPVYEEGEVRNGIYLPEGTWYDYFTGEAYQGGQVLNSFDAPLWKIPVFAREGAIIPMNNPNNNPSQIDTSKRILEVYPSTKATSIDVYDDDGTTDAYLAGQSLTYKVEQQVVKDKATITIHPAEGKGYKGMKERKQTFLIVNLPAEPKKVEAKVNGKKVSADWTFGVEKDMFKYGISRHEQLLITLPETSIHDKVQVEVQSAKFRVQSSNSSLSTQNAALATPLLIKEEAKDAYALTPTWKPVEGADYYELEFDGMRYTNIRDTHYTIDQLQPETDYHMHLRAVQSAKSRVQSSNSSLSTMNSELVCSDWADIDLRTAANPLEFAIRGLTATCSVPDQPGNGIQHLFDLDERGEIWHTNWNRPNAAPYTIDIDMHATTEIERIVYVPRDNAGNGNLLAGTISLSPDGTNWSKPQPFRWQQNNQPKTLAITDLSPLASNEVRFIRMGVDRSVGGFGSGAELYVFRKPDAKVMIPGDINQDGKIDDNDLTSYLNYTGLRQGDGDFDGYVSVGDVNRNGLIDAQDISNVTTLLEGGAGRPSGTLSGTITLKSNV